MPLLLAGKGAGAVCNAVSAQGSFTPSDVYYAEGNINALELLAELNMVSNPLLQSSRIRIF